MHFAEEYVAASDALLKAQKAQSRILELAEHGLTQLDRVIKREAAEEQAKSAVAALRENMEPKRSGGRVGAGRGIPG